MGITPVLYYTLELVSVLKLFNDHYMSSIESLSIDKVYFFNSFSASNRFSTFFSNNVRLYREASFNFINSGSFINLVHCYQVNFIFSFPIPIHANMGIHSRLHEFITEIAFQHYSREYFIISADDIFH